MAKRDDNRSASQIVGFRISRDLAQELKAEAKQRQIRLNQLLAEMWAIYKERGRDGTSAR